MSGSVCSHLGNARDSNGCYFWPKRLSDWTLATGGWSSAEFHWGLPHLAHFSSSSSTSLAAKVEVNWMRLIGYSLDNMAMINRSHIYVSMSWWWCDAIRMPLYEWEALSKFSWILEGFTRKDQCRLARTGLTFLLGCVCITSMGFMLNVALATMWC